MTVAELIRRLQDIQKTSVEVLFLQPGEDSGFPILNVLAGDPGDEGPVYLLGE